MNRHQYPSPQQNHQQRDQLPTAKLVRKSIREFLPTIATFRNPVCATLSYALAKPEQFPLADEFRSRTFQHYLNRINREIYGHKARKTKQGAKLRVFAVHEMNSIGRHHTHALIEPPAHFNCLLFKFYLEHNWNQLEFVLKGFKKNSDDTRPNVHNFIDVNPDLSRTIAYMLKVRSKTDYCDAIDWLNSNFHNPHYHLNENNTIKQLKFLDLVGL